MCIIFYYIEYFKEKHYFFVVNKTDDNKIKDVSDLKFGSTIGMYDGIYTLTIEGTKGQKQIKTSQKISVGKLFDNDGIIHLDQVEEFFKETH